MNSSLTPSFNDLIGLQYDWHSEPADTNGHTNCFALCMEVRKRLGLNDFINQYRHLYKDTEENEIGLRQILRLIRLHGKRIFEARPGAVFYSQSVNGQIAMAVVVDETNALMLAPGGRVICLPFAKVAKGYYYWAD